MSDTSENQPTAGKPEEVRDEVRLDLDEDGLDKWEEVRSNYVVDPESEVAHPALTESEDDDEDDLKPTSEDGEEDDEAEDEESRDEEE
ncbi:hypothetical protein [Knoellia sp. Soil729]|uniref:hypothetical protein n=1 Tax=Knoellia sp. Soil729 TaxID=1736394 RepID=UPI0006FF6397|nr:hypothetical protein [Knoellia sp. Soil729]KRE43689.1 hypothetical protein ASG74_02275 [Knoellia sp. Soil729]